MAAPTVTTKTVTDVAQTTATSGGTVTDDGGAALSDGQKLTHTASIRVA